MNVVLSIPDEIAARLGEPDAVARRALEGVILEAFRSGRIKRAELRRWLGLGSSPALDAFLVSHGLSGAYASEDLEADRRDLEDAGFGVG